MLMFTYVSTCMTYRLFGDSWQGNGQQRAPFPRCSSQTLGNEVMERSTTNVTDTGVCGKNTPPEKKTLRKVSLTSTKSGAGEHFLLKDCKAKAATIPFFVSDTGRSLLGVGVGLPGRRQVRRRAVARGGPAGADLPEREVRKQDSQAGRATGILSPFSRP